MYVFFGSETSPSDFREILDGKALLAAQVLQCDAAGGLLLREADGREWRLTQPDMSCLGLLHGAADAAAASEVREWWQQRSGTALAMCDLSAVRNAAARRAAAGEWVCGRLLAVLAVLGQENKELLNQNRQLRRSYGALQNAFSRVEHFVISNQLHTPVLQYEPARLVSFWRPETPGEKLTQVLPVLSSRLSYFELNFRKPATPGAGELRIALRLEPAGTVLQQWAVPYADVLSGWNSFSPNPVVDEPNEVFLECTWSAVQGAPSIGLAAPHWETPYSISAASMLDPGEEAAHSIGVRIWSGLSGVRAPQLPNAPAQALRGKPRVLNMSVDELTGARQYKLPETVERDYPSVRFLRESGRLLVHPHGEVPTIAALPSPVPEGILAVSADVRTANRDGPAIEYAMAVLESEIAPESIFAEDEEEQEPFAGFSGWHRIRRGEARRISAVLDRSTGPEMQLYLATRLPPGSTEAGAWGTWGGIEFAETALPERPFSRIIDMQAASQAKPQRPAPAAVLDRRSAAALPPAKAAEEDAPRRQPRTRRQQIVEEVEMAELEAQVAELSAHGVGLLKVRDIIPAPTPQALVRMLVSGWHPPEPDGVWGSGAESRLSFPLPSDLVDVDLRLELELAVAAADDIEPAVVEVTLNGASSASALFTQRGSQSLQIAVPELEPESQIDVLIQCSRPVCPALLGLGSDQRLLGARIMRLRLAPVEPVEAMELLTGPLAEAGPEHGNLGAIAGAGQRTSGA